MKAWAGSRDLGRGVFCRMGNSEERIVETTSKSGWCFCFGECPWSDMFSFRLPMHEQLSPPGTGEGGDTSVIRVV